MTKPTDVLLSAINDLLESADFDTIVRTLADAARERAECTPDATEHDAEVERFWLKQAATLDRCAADLRA